MISAEWNAALGIDRDKISHGLVCVEHFEDSVFKRKNKTELKPHAVPTIFNNITQLEENSHSLYSNSTVATIEYAENAGNNASTASTACKIQTLGIGRNKNMNSKSSSQKYTMQICETPSVREEDACSNLATDSIEGGNEQCIPSSEGKLFCINMCSISEFFFAIVSNLCVYYILTRNYFSIDYATDATGEIAQNTFYDDFFGSEVSSDQCVPESDCNTGVVIAKNSQNVEELSTVIVDFAKCLNVADDTTGGAAGAAYSTHSDGK